MGRLGLPELLVILAIIIVIFGANRLPGLGRGIGDAIRGFKEEGKIGPDLTHVVSRLSIGAGRLPNSRGNRAGWITDAPTLKPGVYMPRFALPPEDLQALLDYIDKLQ